jgi:hypothetical protein
MSGYTGDDATSCMAPTVGDVVIGAVVGTVIGNMVFELFDANAGIDTQLEDIPYEDHYTGDCGT